MANEEPKRRRFKKSRQEWNPHWTLKTLYTLASAMLSALKIAFGACLTVTLILLICGVVFVGTLGDYLQNDILTEASNFSIDDYDLEKTSFLYYVDRDGNIQQLQQIYTTTDRQIATLEEIPQDLINATIAIEDKRFYEHQGVDWITTVKACMNMFFGGDSQFGGSTITQQLIKNVSQEKSITVQRKVMEIFRAQLFEREYDKDIIMYEYLNRIYLGKGCYGVKSAAAAYFGKELRSLTTAECASLISITNNPSLFNPYSQNTYKYKGEVRDGAGRNRYRQLNVLSEMLNQGYLTQEEYDEAVAQEMVFKEGIAPEDRWTECENCGYAAAAATFRQEGAHYFCPECGSRVNVSQDASKSVYSWFVDSAILDVARDFAALDGVKWEEAGEKIRNYYLERIQKGGYHIYTTLDMDVQNQVDNIYEDLEKIPTTRSTQQLQSGIVVIDNRTGDVVALSGGVGEKTDFFAYNKATQARLQTGSSQKPISVYAPAFEKGGFSPATVIKDLPLMYDGETNQPFPRNDNRQYNYTRTIFSGIVSSVNAISANTLKAITPSYGYSFAKYNFGEESLIDSLDVGNGQSMSDIDYAPLALGALTKGATVREMSAAYATFANNGTYREPRTYTKVYNSEGQLVLDNTQDSRKILSEKTVEYMNYCLYNAANVGTGGAAIFPGMAIAGKTGTTSSNRDRWFCGYTGYYTAAVWCGYNQPEQINLTGNYGNPAARLWKMVMQPIHEGKASKPLFSGAQFQTVTVCLDSGKLATGACTADCRGSRAVTVNCYPEDAPTEYCDKHEEVYYCVDGGGIATEYCRRFHGVEVEYRSLVKLNPDEVAEIRAAIGSGLKEEYYMDGYVYAVDYAGNPIPWYGFRGSYGGNTAPYLACPYHTQEAWEESVREEETTPDHQGPFDDFGFGGNDSEDNNDTWRR